MTIYRKGAGGLFVVLVGLVVPFSVHAEPLTVSILQLVDAPKQYAGKEVVFEGVLTSEAGTQMLLRPSPFQLVLADPSGAEVLVLTLTNPHRMRPETSLSVHGTFYHIPMDTGPPLQFVVPRPGGLMSVLPWWH